MDIQEKIEIKCESEKIKIKLNCNAVELMATLNSLFNHIFISKGKDTAIKMWTGGLMASCVNDNSTEIAKEIYNLISSYDFEVDIPNKTTS